MYEWRTTLLDLATLWDILILCHWCRRWKYLEIPNDKKILVEHYSEIDKKYILFHSLFGRRVNDVLSRAIAYAIGRIEHKDVELGITDNGFYIAYKGKIQINKIIAAIKTFQLNQNILSLWLA